MVRGAGGAAEPVADRPSGQEPPPLPVHLPRPHSQGRVQRRCLHLYGVFLSPCRNYCTYSKRKDKEFWNTLCSRMSSVLPTNYNVLIKNCLFFPIYCATDPLHVGEQLIWPEVWVYSHSFWLAHFLYNQWLQPSSGEGEVATYWKFLGKNTIFNEHPVIICQQFSSACFVQSASKMLHKNVILGVSKYCVLLFFPLY